MHILELEIKKRDIDRTDMSSGFVSCDLPSSNYQTMNKKSKSYGFLCFFEILIFFRKFIVQSPRPEQDSLER